MNRWLLLVPCLASCAAGSQPASLRPAPPPAAPPHASASSSVPVGSSRPTPPPPAATAASTAGEPEPPLVFFETPYKLGEQPHLVDPDLARRDQRELEVWNRGGRDGKWHPEPRVMIDNVRVKGRIAESVVLREARKQHYWPIRKCYDAALAANQQLHGKLHVQFTVRHAGTIRGARSMGKPTLSDAACVTCIAQSFSSLKLPPTSRGEAVVTLDVSLNPGDLPVAAPEQNADPGPGWLDPHAAQAVIAGRAGHEVQRCFMDGRARVPSLWGRLALRADLDPSGSILSLTESESTFPDPATTTCVIAAVQSVAFPAPRGGGLKLIIPFRLGHPPPTP